MNPLSATVEDRDGFPFLVLKYSGRLHEGVGVAAQDQIQLLAKKSLPHYCERLLAGLEGFEPPKCWNQNPVPYHLAKAQCRDDMLYYTRKD